VPVRHLLRRVCAAGQSLRDVQAFINVELIFMNLKVKLNSVASVRERTKPAERPTLIGEISGNF
jgi:hypothetical protein